ncbi:MAG: NAD-dependent epimerase/dehydratase family protein [Saprospirales bacterium]|jgi:threonine 3-dehydrogenase|nr:NAD-dependent epimerase/dehydratase family protein [Saprospirales bacterium]MBK8921496.1 NAD-dependent epimerase/dehydratase family protein [Saprospirales bacterium]
MKQEHILIIGAGGQIGSVLTDTLRELYGDDRVVASDLHPLEGQSGPTEVLNALEGQALEAVVKKWRINQIYHLAAILSATGEKDPMRAWNVNMTSLFNVLEIARQRGLGKVYFPSSIAVFGREAAPVDTPQYEVLIPETVYGISKVAGENWANYYFRRYGVDVRSLRYPGIIGYQSMPGGGTTDYAVDIYHYAIQKKPFECFLRADTRLPMLYMPDAIRGTVELMEAPANSLSVRTSYNLAGMSFTPEEVASSIRKLMPNFKITYKPDFRQAIADSWPAAIDDSAARYDWHWHPEYDLDAMTKDMLRHLAVKYHLGELA